MSVSPLFFGLLGWLLLYEKQGLAAGCLAASLIHECGHLSILFLRRAYPKSIVVGMFGMRIEREEGLHLPFWDDLLIAAGGPLANLLCCAVFMLLGREQAAAIHLVMALFNMHPMELLDGGQMLLAGLYHHMSRERAERLLLIVSVLTLFPLGVAGFLVFFQSGCSVSLLAVDAYLTVLLIFRRKR